MNTEKKDILNRLKRAEGQLRGIQKMIEDEQECIDIVTQLTAVRSSINRTMGLVMSNRITRALQDPNLDLAQLEEKLQQALDLIVKKSERELGLQVLFLILQ